jgi:hypothetical protein
MDYSRTLVIGHRYPVGPDLRLSALMSTENLSEFSTIIWFPETLALELLKGSAAMSFDTMERALFRLIEIEQWLREGHSLIVSVPQFETIPVQSESAQAAPQVDLTTLDIFGGIAFSSASGGRVALCGPAEAMALLQPFVGKVRYRSILESKDLRPLMRVHRARNGQAQIVAGFRKVGAGTLVLVPPIAADDVSEQERFLKALAALPLQLRFVPAVLPEWVKNFWTEDEATARSAISSAQESISALEAEIACQQEVIAEASSLKQLIAGTGDPFKDAVAAGLKELGLEVVDGPHPRADLLAFDGSALIVVEAKGLDGPIRENNLRQIERWTAEARATLSATPEERAADPDLIRYAEQIEKIGAPLAQQPPLHCKGVMIIGTYRNTPLDERKGADFPDAMARKIAMAHVCALTGLDLFVLLMLARANPALKGDTVQRLLETNGRLNVTSDWQAHLRKMG